MALEQPTIDTANDEKQAQIDFESGMAAEESPDNIPAVVADAIVAEPEATPPAQPAVPEYVQLTRDQFAMLDAAAQRTVALEHQLSRVFGTVGNMQQIVNDLKSQTPRGAPITVPKDAFAGLAKDYPELAEQLRVGLETTLKGAVGTGAANAEVDPAKLHMLVGQYVAHREMERAVEALNDAYPTWREIIGAVDANRGQTWEAYYPNNAYRRWLVTKDANYQQRLNMTNDPSIVMRSIRLFQSETRAKPTTSPGNGRSRLANKFFAAKARAAIQPRGDGGRAAPSETTDDFESGFATG